MVVEGGSFVKDLILIGREFQKRGEELRKERREFKLGGERWKEETEMVGGTRFTSRFDTDKISQIGLLRFMEEFTSNRYDFILHALFDLEPLKRFECRSDV